MPPPKKKPETEEEKQKREKSIQAAKNYRLLKKQQVADQEKKVDELMKENKRLLDEETSVNTKSRDLENSIVKLRRQLAAMGPSRSQPVSAGIAAGLPETDLDRRLSSSTVNSNHSNPNQPYAAGPIMPDLDSNLALSMGLGVGANLGLDTDMGLAATGLGVGGNLGRDSGLNVDQGVEALAVDPTNLHVGGFGGFLDMGNADWQSDFLRSYTTGANDLLANGLASTHLPSGLSTQADLALGPGAMGEVQGNEPSLLANLNDIDANTLANLNLPDLDFQSLATGFPPLDLGSNNNGLDGPLALNLPLNVDGDVGGLTGVVPNAIQPTEAMENAARISAMIQQQHMSQQMALLNDLNAHTNPSVGVGLSTMGMGNLHAQPALSEADTALYLHRDASTRTQMGGQPDQTHADESDPGTKHSVGSDPQVFRTPTHQQILLRSPLQQPPQVHPSQATNQVTQMHASFGLAQTTDYGLTQPPLNQRTPQGPHTAGHTETWGGGQAHTHSSADTHARGQTAHTQSPAQTPERIPARDIEPSTNSPADGGKVDEAPTPPLR